MEQDVTPVSDRLDARLGIMRGKEHLPPDLVELLGDVARMQLEAEAEARLELPRELAPAEEVLHGRALVDRECFPHDRGQARELFTRLLERLRREPGGLGEAAQTVERELEQGGFDLDQAFDAVLAEDQDFFEQWEQRTPEAPRTLYFLAFSALGPGLHAAARKLADSLPEVNTWHAGTCPVCGGLPLVTELRGKEGQRYASCAFCGFEYRIRRLACAVCGESEPGKLHFFTVDEEPGYRVDVCRSCNCYVKGLDFREMDRSSLPRFDDLDSLALDFVAAEQGFHRPTLSGWGF